MLFNKIVLPSNEIVEGAAKEEEEKKDEKKKEREERVKVVMESNYADEAKQNTKKQFKAESRNRTLKEIESE